MDNKIWKNAVLLISLITILLFIIIGVIIQRNFDSIANTLFTFTQDNFGWLYLLIVFAIIIFLVGLAISKYGAIRLGSDESRPEYPFFTWIGMLFSAGFGVSLVFFGVAEPMSHFFDSPTA